MLRMAHTGEIRRVRNVYRREILNFTLNAKDIAFLFVEKRDVNCTLPFTLRFGYFRSLLLFSTYFSISKTGYFDDA